MPSAAPAADADGSPGSPGEQSPRRAASGRLDEIDWLRGLAVVLMIQTHLYDAWVAPAFKQTDAYWVTRYVGGFPARLFLFLVGVSLAVQIEALLARGLDAASARAKIWKRGLQIVLLAYVFRVQEWVLGGMGDNWADIARVDILNCIGACLLVVPLVAFPRRGRPAYARALAAAAFFLGLGPLLGPAHFPDWLPRPLTSYLGGERPMSWFGLFPWAAWAFVGLAAGHLWMRVSRDPGRRGKMLLWAGVAGAAITFTVTTIRRIDPNVIRYPSDLVQQMGPGAFFYRLGLIGVLAALASIVTRASRGRFSPMRQLGRTSLLVYWVHVDLCYGLVSKPLHHQLDMRWATIGFGAMTIVMLALSVAKTRLFEPWWRGHGLRRPAAFEAPPAAG